MHTCNEVKEDKKFYQHEPLAENVSDDNNKINSHCENNENEQNSSE